MRNKHSGFTLLELMVVLAISGIMLLVGVPSFKSMLVSNELTSITNDFTMSLKLARGSAVSSGHSAFVCSSATAADAAPKCDDDSWNKGWLVWIDSNDDNVFKAAEDELLWVKVIGSSSQITIAPATGSTDFADEVKFRYTGTLFNELPGAFELCSGYSSDGYPMRVITLSASGEPQYSKDLTTKC